MTSGMAIEQDFDVYLAQSQEQLEKKRGLKDHAWCGFQKVLFDDERCRTSLSPFGVTYVFVPQPRRGTLPTLLVSPFFK